VKYLLDTNAWIRYLNQPASPIGAKLALFSPADIGLCSVVLGELYYGAHRSSRRAANLGIIGLLAQQFISLPFDDAAAAMFGQVRAHLARLGTLIGPYDLQIAAIALTHNLTLVTHNTNEFKRVPGLMIEDWESTP
jgi:tRNA(fMet)-specific endonuclease VapC